MCLFKSVPLSHTLGVGHWDTSLLSRFESQKPLKLPLTKPFVILNHLRVFLIYMKNRCLDKLLYCDKLIM
jgi:hypothetical protein